VSNKELIENAKILADPKSSFDIPRVAKVTLQRMLVALEAAESPTTPEPVDERIEAWDRIARHPFFRECYDSEAPLTDAMLVKLSQSPTTGTVHDLDQIVDKAADNGESVQIRDASHRPWIIYSDEEGDYWATSYTHEDDDAPMPCRFESASIRYPVEVLS